MTMRSAMTGTEGNDADPKIVYGYDSYNQSTNKELCVPLRAGEGDEEKPKVIQIQAKAVRLDMNMGGDFLTDEAQTIRSGASATIKGGVIMSETIGFKAGQSKDGGLGDEREVSPTLSHKPSALEPTVAQSTFVRIGSMTRRDRPTPPSEEVAHALTKTDGDAGDNAASVIQSLAAMRYIVRRLTPKEAERLMGLPDGYTIPAGLDPNDPALVAEFQRIFDTFGAIMAEYEHAKPPKPKTAAQVQKWLEKIADPDTCPDSPRYKACGNGWATNQPRWILTRLLHYIGIDPFTGEEL